MTPTKKEVKATSDQAASMSGFSQDSLKMDMQNCEII